MRDPYPPGGWEPNQERWPPGRSDDAWNQSGQVPYWDNPASVLPHLSYRRPQRPRSIQTAVLLMRVAAGLVGFLLILNIIGSHGLNIFFGSGSFVGIVLWLVMASNAGERWARTIVTGFFALGTLGAAWGLWDLAAVHAFRHLPSGFGGLLSTAVQAGVLSTVGVWVLHLTIIVLLWSRESSAYYAATG